MLSRVADSFYWMSRYLERAEHSARVVEVYLGLTLDGDSDEAGQALLVSLGALAPREPTRRPRGRGRRR